MTTFNLSFIVLYLVFYCLLIVCYVTCLGTAYLQLLCLFNSVLTTHDISDKYLGHWEGQLLVRHCNLVLLFVFHPQMSAARCDERHLLSDAMHCGDSSFWRNAYLDTIIINQNVTQPVLITTKIIYHFWKYPECLHLFWNETVLEKTSDLT